MRVIHPNLQALASFSLFILFSGWAFAQTAADPLGSITSALRNQDFAEALVLLRPALQQSPRNAQLWTMQGVAYVGKGIIRGVGFVPQRAEDLSRLSSRVGGSNPDRICEAGMRRRFPFCSVLLRLRPADRTSHGMLAVLEYQQGELCRCSRSFRKSRCTI